MTILEQNLEWKLKISMSISFVTYLSIISALILISCYLRIHRNIGLTSQKNTKNLSSRRIYILFFKFLCHALKSQYEQFIRAWFSKLCFRRTIFHSLTIRLLVQTYRTILFEVVVFLLTKRLSNFNRWTLIFSDSSWLYRTVWKIKISK